MGIDQEIETLPVLLVEAMLSHDFFTAANIKKRQEELKKWVQMNGGK